MNRLPFPAILFALTIVFIIFSSEQCKEKSGQEDPAKTEQQEQPKQPETSTPPEGYKPPVVDTSGTTSDPDCIVKTEEQHKIPCPDVYDPVCGCDGKNYANPCEAKRADVSKWEKGRCD